MTPADALPIRHQTSSSAHDLFVKLHVHCLFVCFVFIPDLKQKREQTGRVKMLGLSAFASNLTGARTNPVSTLLDLHVVISPVDRTPWWHTPAVVWATRCFQYSGLSAQCTCRLPWRFQTIRIWEIKGKDYVFRVFQTVIPNWKNFRRWSKSVAFVYRSSKLEAHRTNVGAILKMMVHFSRMGFPL